MKKFMVECHVPEQDIEIEVLALGPENIEHLIEEHLTPAGIDYDVQSVREVS